MYEKFRGKFQAHKWICKIYWTVILWIRNFSIIPFSKFHFHSPLKLKFINKVILTKTLKRPFFFFFLLNKIIFFSLRNAYLPLSLYFFFLFNKIIFLFISPRRRLFPSKALYRQFTFWLNFFEIVDETRSKTFIHFENLLHFLYTKINTQYTYIKFSIRVNFFHFLFTKRAIFIFFFRKEYTHTRFRLVKEL